MPKLILGLGNPGEPYRDTRHNVGFRAVEELARRWGVALGRLECNSLVGSTLDAGRSAGGQDSVLLALPQTYMNRSGYAARCLTEIHGFEPESVLVVYDEVSLPLGRLRMRKAGSPAGHRGMESVIENLRSDQIPRLRMGVAGPEGPPPGEALADFVLSPFAGDEREAVEAMVLKAADACEAWVQEGADVAMNRFNG